MGQQLNPACRALLAMLLLRRHNPGAPKAQRDAFKTVCAEVQIWLRDEIAEIRHVKPSPKTAPPRGKSRPKVDHA